MLMQGIEIMTSQEIVIAHEFNWFCFWITFCLIFGIALILGIGFFISGESDWQIILALGIVGLIFGSFFGFAIGDKFAKPIEYTTEYKVTIEDSVPLAEFYERYEIIGQEGKMYIVRERT